MKAHTATALALGLLVGFASLSAVGCRSLGSKTPAVESAATEASPSPCAPCPPCLQVEGEETKASPPPPPWLAPPRRPSTTIHRVPVGNAPVLGPADALVTVVVFSSFQCAFSAMLNETLVALQKEMAEKGKPFRIVAKQFPLEFQKNARPAAMAALAAGAQGKYWQMHALLFQNMQDVAEDSLKNHANQLRLNMSKFNAALKNKTFETQIEEDLELGSDVGVRGTPASFVNGRLVSGAWPKEDLEALIEEEMATAQKLVELGMPAARVYEKILESANAVDRSNIPIPPNAPSKGPKNAPVTVLIWSDFECVFCSIVNPTLKELEERYPSQVRFVFRHLQLNRNSKAAEASMAAHAQGKFWEMHDLLLENQKALELDSLLTYAQRLNLDLKKFKHALDNNTYADYVKNDSATAKEFSIRGAPAFIINGKEVLGAQPIEVFSKAIDDALRKAKRPPAK